MAPFHRLPRGFGLRVVDQGFISRDSLRQEAPSLVALVQNTLDNSENACEMKFLRDFNVLNTDMNMKMLNWFSF